MTILNPAVVRRAAPLAGAPRSGSLRDAAIGFVDNSKLNANAFIDRLQPVLRERYGIRVGAKVRKFAPKDELTERDLSALVKCAAVIQCFGD
jgi:hypothetical protein